MGGREEEGKGVQGGRAEPFLPGAAWIFLDDDSVQLSADSLHLANPGTQTWAPATQHEARPSAIGSQSLGFKRFNSTCQHVCYVQASPPQVFQQSLCSVKDWTECLTTGSILHS